MLSPKNSLIAISRYNEPIEWVKKLTEKGYKSIIYDKCNPLSNTTIPLNKGHEASAFLKYIIDHYYNLPEYSVLIHAEEFSWHHDGSIVDIIQMHEGFDGKFKNINRPSLKLSGMCIEMIPILQKYLEPEMGPLEYYGDWMGGGIMAAQFIVHKDLILNRSIKFYRDLYKWFLETEVINYSSGRYLEWSWHMIWDQVLPVKRTFKTDKNLYSLARNSHNIKKIALELIGSDFEQISKEEFIRRLYRNVLLREPDQGGFEDHLKGSDTHREYKVLEFLFSVEARVRGITQKLGYEPTPSE
jgi:hypothetical protein